jgi:hypothetical protein
MYKLYYKKDDKIKYKYMGCFTSGNKAVSTHGLDYWAMMEESVGNGSCGLGN